MSRWLQETGGSSGEEYDARFAALAATGASMHGEVDFLERLLAPGASVLDAGCGTGRVAVELARRGHDVTGADNDSSMLAVARRSPGVLWAEADLSTLDLGRAFDLIVAAGNVMVFLEPGTEAEVAARLAAHLAPGGLLVCGWRTDRLRLPTYQEWVERAGLEPVARYATWDAEPWRDDATWCVAVDRLPGAAS